MTAPPAAAAQAGLMRYRAGRRVTLVSVAANLHLTLAQIVIGTLGHSQALVADGFHTLSDLITDFMVLYALWHGRKVADEEHPYGHARIETAVTVILGAVLVVIGVGIAARAGWRLAIHDAFVMPAVVTLWVAVGTLTAKEALFRYTMRVANRYGSELLRANAWHHRSDALSSLIVVAGIGGTLLGFLYLDAVAAVIVALMVVKVGAGLAWRALKELIDTGLTREELKAIRRTILSVSGVKAVHGLRTRRFGGRALVDVHIIVDDRLSVSEGHQIGEAVRAKLMREVAPVADVMVHIDTEEDVERPSGAGLPLREEIERRLRHYFRDIPAARRIERITLHYIGGRIDVDLRLPLEAVQDRKEAEQLAERFRHAARSDPHIGQINVVYF
jgi:cation diffusion facilitator family transporter